MRFFQIQIELKSPINFPYLPNIYIDQPIIPKLKKYKIYVSQMVTHLSFRNMAMYCGYLCYSFQGWISSKLLFHKEIIGSVRVSRKNELLRSFVLFKFINIDSCLQLIMCVFPMEVCL